MCGMSKPVPSDSPEGGSWGVGIRFREGRPIDRWIDRGGDWVVDRPVHTKAREEGRRFDRWSTVGWTTRRAHSMSQKGWAASPKSIEADERRRCRRTMLDRDRSMDCRSAHRACSRSELSLACVDQPLIGYTCRLDRSIDRPSGVPSSCGTERIQRWG